MGHNSMVFGHLKFTGIPLVDELSTGPPETGASHSFSFFITLFLIYHNKLTFKANIYLLIIINNLIK